MAGTHIPLFHKPQKHTRRCEKKKKIHGFSPVWKHVAQTEAEEIKLGFALFPPSFFTPLLFASIILAGWSSANNRVAKIWAGFTP